MVGIVRNKLQLTKTKTIRRILFDSNFLLKLSIGLNVVLLLGVYSSNITSWTTEHRLNEKLMEWDGGHPLKRQSSHCICRSKDDDCVCTPNLAIDVIIASHDEDNIWMIERSDSTTTVLATMGGFVEVGESVEDAVLRELKEEMNIVLPSPTTDNMRLLGVYSDARRDNRRHTISAVYAIQLPKNHIPKAGDDAKNVIPIPIKDIQTQQSYFADHKTIFMDYYYQKMTSTRQQERRQNYGDFADNIQRSLCII